jgi:hypothetical protein
MPEWKAGSAGDKPPNALRISRRRRRAASERAKLATISRAEGGQLHAQVGRARRE